MKKKEIKIPIYNERLVIYKNANWDKINKKFDFEPDNDYDGIAYLHKGVIYCAFEKGVDSSVIAHESIHVANYVYEHIRADVDVKNDEPYAYLVGWIVKQIDAFLNEEKQV